MLNTYDRYGGTVVELDRGPVNAFDLELLGALTAAFDRADSPVVLTGASRTFSSGVDLRRSSSRIRATFCGVSAFPGTAIWSPGSRENIVPIATWSSIRARMAGDRRRQVVGLDLQPRALQQVGP